MEKGYNADCCSHELLPGDERTGTTWCSFAHNNRRLKQSVKALMVLLAAMGIILVAFAYLTIQLGKERDLVLHLEEQIHDYEKHGNTVTKRSIPWLLGAALWTGNQIFSLYGLAHSCKSFSKSNLSAASCVWSALSTAVTAIGIPVKGVQKVRAIHERLNQNGIRIGNWKRDDNMIMEAETELSNLLNFPATLDGFIPHHHPKLARLNLTEGSMWPVFHFYNHQQTGMHFTMTGFEEDHALMTLGFGHKTNETNISKRETYDDDYFTNGGIDFTHCYNYDENHYKLNEGSDYQQMDRDVECYTPDLSNAWGAQFQLYDSNIEGTIGSGSVAPYKGKDHASSISDMPGCPSSIQPSNKCETA